MAIPSGETAQAPGLRAAGHPPALLEPVHEHFGVRVHGLDLRNPLPPARLAELHEAFDTHSLLIFPDQPLSRAEFVRFAEQFGPIDTVKVGSVGAGSKVSRSTNLREDGEIDSVSGRLSLTVLANQQWHTDSSFKSRPALATALLAELLPPVGGETEFASTRAAFEALPDDLRMRACALSGFHSYAYSRDRIAPGLMSEAERCALPRVEHPLVRQHPVTGTRSLFIGAHLGLIRGLSPAAGRSIIEQLTGFATDDRFVYRHAWQQHDLLLWDNRCTLHRGRPWDMARYGRVLSHISIADTGPDCDAPRWPRAETTTGDIQ
ncbi:MAG: TauD/TfdA family dioxygenase [Pseudomonadota bacterium]